MAHSPPNTIIYEEVGIPEPSNHTMPHGYIDILTVSHAASQAVVAVHCCLDNKNEISVSSSKVTATTVKTTHAYNLPGSDRQAIVEFLALSQALLKSNPALQCCIILKASRHLCRPFFYLPQFDMLIRTTCDIRLERESYCSDLTGSFVVALILHHHFNYQQFTKLKAFRCGWAEAYTSSGMQYGPRITP